MRRPNSIDHKPRRSESDAPRGGQATHKAIQTVTNPDGTTSTLVHTVGFLFHTAYSATCIALTSEGNHAAVRDAGLWWGAAATLPSGPSDGSYCTCVDNLGAAHLVCKVLACIHLDI